MIRDWLRSSMGVFGCFGICVGLFCLAVWIMWEIMELMGPRLSPEFQETQLGQGGPAWSRNSEGRHRMTWAPRIGDGQGCGQGHRSHAAPARRSASSNGSNRARADGAFYGAHACGSAMGRRGNDGHPIARLLERRCKFAGTSDAFVHLVLLHAGHAGPAPRYRFAQTIVTRRVVELGLAPQRAPFVSGTSG